MTTQMYKYIKGKEVFVEEHMLSASEIAEKYGIYTTNKNKRPHGMLVAAILKQFINSVNLNISEYYYPHSKGVMKVYPEIVWKDAMRSFISDNDIDIKSSDEILTHTVIDEKNKRRFSFIHESKNKKSNVISIDERRRFNVK